MKVPLFRPVKNSLSSRVALSCLPALRLGSSLKTMMKNGNKKPSTMNAAAAEGIPDADQ
jgi:hypothetical protein